jgi:hypothetical protein
MLAQTRTKRPPPDILAFRANDPLGYNAGSSNLYEYVGNQPTNETDPTGLKLEGTLEITRNFQGLKDSPFTYSLPNGGKAKGEVQVSEANLKIGEKTEKGFIVLTFKSDTDVKDAHWLQFIYRGKATANDEEVTGKYLTPAPDLKKSLEIDFGVKGRHVDASSMTSPFYTGSKLPNWEATDKSLTMIDLPTAPGLRKDEIEKFTADAYLINGSCVIYHVRYEADFTNFGGKGTQRTYTVIDSGVPKQLPDYLKGKTLYGGYIREDKKVLDFPNPVK